MIPKNQSAMQHTYNHLSNKAKKGTRGLTLVESLVAISILVISVFGPMSIVSQAIRTAYLTRDQMTAFYLAQESIEYVRNVRDKNSMMFDQAGAWLYDMEYYSQGAPFPQINNAGTLSPVTYYMTIEPTTTGNQPGYRLTGCAASCPKINVNRLTREYGAPTVGGDIVPSIYTREITFWNTAAGADPVTGELVVQVVMKWSHNGNAYRYVVRDYLKNWKLAP